MNFILFVFLYSRFLLVIYFIHTSVCMSIPISQFIPPPPLPPPLSFFGVHTLVLYICVSISALQTNIRNLLLKVLEDGSLRSGHQQGWVRAFVWVTDFLLYPHTADWAKVFWGISSIKALIPFMRAPPLLPNHLQKALPPNNHHLWGLRFKRESGVGDTTIQTKANTVTSLASFPQVSEWKIVT